MIQFLNNGSPSQHAMYMLQLAQRTIIFKRKMNALGVYRQS